MDDVLLALEPVTPAAAVGATALLSPPERARVAAIRLASRADAVAVSLALARRVLGALTGLDPAGLAFTSACERCGHPSHGRPRLAAGAVADAGADLPHFSVSRSEGWAAVAVAPVPVGVDVEDPGRAVDAAEIVPVLSPVERRWAAGRSTGDLLALWVVKEAAGKAMGIGIVGVEACSVVAGEDDDLAGWRTVAGAAAGTWSVTRVDAPGAVVAVGVAGDPRPVRPFGGDGAWS